MTRALPLHVGAGKQACHAAIVKSEIQRRVWQIDSEMTEQCGESERPFARGGG